MNLIDEFITRYRKEYDFFDQAARLGAQMLDAQLRAAGIRSIVSSRAKAIERLQTKVQQRALTRQTESRKPYECVEEIFSDVIDLAGIRVAMYFPGDHGRIDGIVRDIFEVKGDPRHFPELSRKAKHTKKFSGYSAIHYRAHLKHRVLSDGQQRYSEAALEIQVASVLMHAWAEVEHDLVYKPQRGDLSVEEYAILDQLNGMVLAGEIALERLQTAGEIRVAASERRFANHYELAAHLISVFGQRSATSIGDTALGRIDLLYEMLSRLNIATPNSLKRYIESVNSDFEKRPLAEQVIDHLLAEDENRYELYEVLRASRPVAGDHVRDAREHADSDVESNVFLRRWVALEQKINAEARRSGKERIYPSSKLLSRLGIEDQTLLNDFERIKHLRNEVVHGLSTPDAADLRDAAVKLQEIVAQLD